MPAPIQRPSQSWAHLTENLYLDSEKTKSGILNQVQNPKTSFVKQRFFYDMKFNE